MLNDETTYTMSQSELARLLAFTVHHPECEAVVYRRDQPPVCSCGLSGAMQPIRIAESGTRFDQRLASNRDVFSGRSVPAWLCQLVPAKYRPVSHKNRYAPSERSDG